MIIFVAHFCGCGFYYVSYQEFFVNQYYDCWINYNQLIGKDWTEAYTTSLYYAVVTMITLGYGDLVPRTTNERIYVIVIALICCGVFAYSVNKIGAIVEVIIFKLNFIIINNI